MVAGKSSWDWERSRTIPLHTLAVFVNNRFSAGPWQGVAIDSMYRLYYGDELLA